MSTKRMLQLGEQIRDHIAMMLVRGEIHDPRVKGVTIHSVKLTSDLQTAKVYFICPQEKQKETLQGLKQAAGFIRHELGKKLQIRYTPHVIFFYDDSIEHSLKMTALLSKISEEFQEDEDQSIRAPQSKENANE